MSDVDVYKIQNFGSRVGFGKRPALLIIDFQIAFTDAKKLGGSIVNAAIRNTVVLLSMARRLNMPVAHSRYVVQDDRCDMGPFGVKVPNLRLLTESAQDSQFVSDVAPVNGEFIALKKHSSAFFGTMLAPWLISRSVDTLLVAGCSTSGCVRASVVDACAYGFRTIVVEDCVGDRAEGPHRANLFDMDQKYADVLPMSEVLAHDLFRSGSAA